MSFYTTSHVSPLCSLGICKMVFINHSSIFTYMSTTKLLDRHLQRFVAFPKPNSHIRDLLKFSDKFSRQTYSDAFS